MNAHVTVAKWPPRQPAKILIGTVYGEIKIVDVDKKNFEISYIATHDEKLGKAE